MWRKIPRGKNLRRKMQIPNINTFCNKGLALFVPLPPPPPPVRKLAYLPGSCADNYHITDSLNVPSSLEMQSTISFNTKSKLPRVWPVGINFLSPYYWRYQFDPHCNGYVSLMKWSGWCLSIGPWSSVQVQNCFTIFYHKLCISA